MTEQQQKPKPKNPWIEFWVDLLGKEVRAEYYIAQTHFVVDGTLRLFNWNKDSCVIQKENGDIIWVRIPISITRKVKRK